MSIILVGYRGSGKTTVGRLVASRLGWPFVDSDEEIVRRAGKTIKSIFEESGEPAFRDLESAVLIDYGKLQKHVISLGGGALMREENRNAVWSPSHKVVYLKCNPQALHDRIHADPATGDNRPHLTQHAGDIDEITHLLSVREPGYQEIMDLELDVTDLSPDDAANQIAKLVK